jgi:multidrug efflux pump
MRFTDIYIRRPVLACVVSLLVMVLGLRSLASLPVNQFPKIETAEVTVSTTYFGADANTISGFITQPLESSIAQAQGIEYMSSTSIPGISTITVTLKLNRSANAALTEITTQVNAVKNQLPPQAQTPVITVVAGGQTVDAMYLRFQSSTMEANSVTDYVQRVVKPKLDGLEGVQTAEIIGGRQFALRAWLDPARMAGHSITAGEIYSALGANNYLATLGTSKGQMVSIPLTGGTDMHSVEEFKDLIIKRSGTGVVHLRDVANVMLGAENYDLNVAFAGKQAVFVGIKTSPTANSIQVVKKVREVFPSIESQFPVGLTGGIAYDATEYINTSIYEVEKTLIETLAIVTLVIFLFLGSVRAVVIPVLAMPLSLIGTFFVMLVLGYSINLLTLLALVLAIGLVVDDAIIVVENVDRHMREEGKTPYEAALIAARELGNPIIAMTIVLIAVYIPIGFQGGLTGALFTEFAFTLAGSVAVSGVIALTLSPMMCSRLFKADHKPSGFVAWLERRFHALRAGYQRWLASTLKTWSVMTIMGLMLLGGTAYLYSTSASELAPQEDQGFVVGFLSGPANATADQMQLYAKQMFEAGRTLPEFDYSFQLTGVPSVNQGIGGIVLKPYDQRSRSANQIQQELQKRWGGIAGAKIAAFQFPPLPGAKGLPMQFVITTTESFPRLKEVADEVLARAQRSGMFFFIDSDLKIDAPQTVVKVNREMAANLGLNAADVGNTLGAALGGNYVNYFAVDGRSYKVIPQTQQSTRLNPEQILDYQLKAPDGSMFPARTIVSLEKEVVPETISHFQQFNSATIAGVYTPFTTQAEVVAFLNKTLKEVAPSGFNSDYSGGTRQFVQESGGFVTTLFFAIVIVFLALAAQFESFRDPVVILVSVPMALFGSLIFINLGLSTLNIYTQVGLVTLMGLISKHGILMVEFANKLQAQGHNKFDAIVEAAGVRLRPILMTTAAMVLGVLPLVIASGAGAAGRRAMGLVIFTGLSIGTLFTLFVVPAVYMMLAAAHQHDLDPVAADRDGSGSV